MSPIFDSHFHLDASLVSASGLVVSMDAAGIARTALIANLCPPIALSPFAIAGSAVLRRLIHRPDGLLAAAGRALYRNTVKDNGTVDLLGRSYEVKVQPRNDEVLEAVAAHPDRFWGWVFVNPAGPVDPLPEIERCMAAPGMIGVKAHPFWHNYPVSLLLDVGAFCQEIGWPMLLHLGVAANGDYQALPQAFPRLKVVYAHAGIPYSPAICDYARAHDNVFVDLASTGYVDAGNAREAVRRAGVDKCLFGTDGPYFHCEGDRYDYKDSFNMMDQLRLTDQDREKIMSGNFAHLIS